MRHLDSRTGVMRSMNRKSGAVRTRAARDRDSRTDETYGWINRCGQASAVKYIYSQLNGM